MKVLAQRIAFSFAFAAAPIFAQDSKPVLLSRTGGGAWSSIAELKASAQRGNPKACAQRGEMLLHGAKDVPQDVPRAIALLEQAARAGEAAAAFSIGMLLETGDHVALDQTRALAYFRGAAAGGAGEAFHNLGVAYSPGRGVKRDYAEALAWLLLAKKHGASSSVADELRAHVKSLGHPEWIADGERRAPEIEHELAAGSVVKLLPPPAPLGEVAVSKPEPAVSGPP